jgi:Fe-S cluster biosynthesis and repair protein YggX
MKHFAMSMNEENLNDFKSKAKKYIENREVDKGF